MEINTLELILEFFKSKGSEVLVTTRELLEFGLRSSVDSCVFKLVHEEAIVRVARGVFHLAGRNTPVSVEEVAAVKARSFGRNIMKDARRIADELGLVPRSQPENVEHSFQIDGRTSSFKFGTITIKLKGTSKKNFVLGDTPQGQMLRALLATGKSSVTADVFENTVQKLQPAQQLSLINSCSFITSWLGDLVLRWFFNSKVGQQSPSISSIMLMQDIDYQSSGSNLVSEDLCAWSSLSPPRRSNFYAQEYQANYSAAATMLLPRRNE